MTTIVWSGAVEGIEYRLVHIFDPVKATREPHRDRYVLERSSRADAMGKPVWDNVPQLLPGDIAAEIAYRCYLQPTHVAGVES